MIVLNTFQYIMSFVVLWLASEVIVDGIDHFSKKFRISSFAASFFVLGLLTSLPEIGVGVSSLVDKSPEIFVGNLIGASFVLFLLAIPLLAIFGKGITLSHQLTNKNLVFALFVILTPVIFVLDGHISTKEGLFMVILYLLLFYFIESKQKVVREVEQDIEGVKKSSTKQLIRVIGGCAMIFFASKILVDKTVFFAQVLNIHTYLISLVILSVGTNLPEFAIAVNAILHKHKEIAFGDYVGSAAANTLIFGLLTMFHGSFTVSNGNFILTFVIFTVGMIFFYLFSRSKREISSQEGFLLLLIYVAFLVLEIWH